MPLYEGIMLFVRECYRYQKDILRYHRYKRTCVCFMTVNKTFVNAKHVELFKIIARIGWYCIAFEVMLLFPVRNLICRMIYSVQNRQHNSPTT